MNLSFGHAGCATCEQRCGTVASWGQVIFKKEWLQLRSEYKSHKSSSSSAQSITAAAPQAGCTWMPKVRRGCVVKLSGFSQPQTVSALVCEVVSIKQFAEHAVVVEYCDYHPGAPVAHLRLGAQSPVWCSVVGPRLHSKL
eukprot:4958422-Amphidinium_carterae.1